MNTASKFIVFEGIDGAGKTTQIELLKKALEERGISCYTTAEPTTMPSGKEIRRALSGELKKTPLEMAEMFARDRALHNTHPEEGIETKLKAGITVISDRYYYSSLAYQGSVLGYDIVARLNLENENIRKPDLCIFLDLTPEKSLERIGARADVPTEIYENREYLEKTRKTFFDTFERLKARGENIIIIDAFGTPDEVAERIFAATAPLFE